MSQQNVRSQISMIANVRSGGISAEMLETVPEEPAETDVPILADQINDLDDYWIAEFVSSDVTVEDLLTSTDFLNEQKKLLLEFEAQRMRAEEKHDTPTPPRRPRRGRSSIGVKISCPICLESLNSTITYTEEKLVTECGHIFCKSCIEDVSLVKKGRTLCPVCRENIGQLRKVFI